MSLSDAHVLSTRALPPLSRLLVTMALTIEAWELRYRTRKHLGDLPPHILRDIGIDGLNAAREAEKPFWRA